MSITQNIINNVNTILKDRKMNKGDFEKQLGVSVGYLARTSASNTTLTVDKLIKMSELLDVRLEDLCNRDYTLESELTSIDDELERLAKKLEDLQKEAHNVKKVFRNDMLIEWLRKTFNDNLHVCGICPVSRKCAEVDDYPACILCCDEHAEDFKREIIDMFSTDVEVE